MKNPRTMNSFMMTQHQRARLYMVLVLLGLSSAGAARPPQSGVEWRAFGDQLFALYRAGAYSQVLQTGQAAAAQLLAPSERHYLPTICIALSLNKLNRPQEALPFFEKALTLELKTDNLNTYLQALAVLNMRSRGVGFLRQLPTYYPDQRSALEAYTEFYDGLVRGDEAYLAGDKRTAQAAYQRALDAYGKIPVSPTENDAFTARVLRVADEYTYYYLYDTPDGVKRYEILDQSFLKAKLRLCQDVPPQDKRVTFKMAAVIIRNTDLKYEDKGQQKAEQSHLDDNELAFYQHTWQFAMDAVEHATAGQFKVQTTWIDLPQVTLRGLHDWMWHDRLHVRHFDPAQLDPPQDDFFKKIVGEYDGVVFVWHRGEAARAYGGGPIELPYHGGKLPARGGIKSMPMNSTDCLHEFLHNMGRATGYSPHGLKGNQAKVLADYRAKQVTDQVDWYTYMLGAAKDWQRAKFLHEANAGANETDANETGGD
ncbi:MAG: hypothetical protein JO316_08520 [Abitibacteriaceae bacterium]|nr:hypothetical protein [Abditibacteriaceae bacterium]